MKKKNPKKIAAGVLAAALVFQTSAVTAVPTFALDLSPRAADTTDPETPPLPTEATTQAATQPATQAATQAATSDPATPPLPTDPTEAATQAATQPATQAATQPATQAPTQPATEAPTEAATEKQDPTEATNDALTLTGGTAIPSALDQGAFLIVKGTVSSANSDITSVNVGVYDSNGTKLSGGTAQPNAKTYDLNRLDRYVVFDKLAAGTYTYRVTASNATHTNVTLSELTFTVSGADPAADTLTITGGTSVPAELTQGTLVDVTGIVTSASSNITSVSVGIYDTAGNKLSGTSVIPNAKTYDLKALDEAVFFDKLTAGTYTYKVIASNSGNANYTIVNQTFKVIANGATADALTISGGMTIPSNLSQGQAVNVTGTVTSASSNITSLTAGVYDESGKLVTGKTVSPNAKTFDLRKVDNDVAFSKLPAGKYKYSVIASNAANTNFALVTQEFTVGTPASQTDSLTVSGVNTIPTSLNVGQMITLTGTVTSASSNITSLTAGVYDTNGKLVSGKTVAPNAKTYNLGLLDEDVKFSSLAAGSYTYEVRATNSANSNQLLVTLAFTVGNGGQTTPVVNDTLTISGSTNLPENIAVGQAVNVTGVVTSASSNITALTVGVYDMSGKFVTGRTIAPNAKSYDLKKLDSYVAFNKLAAGKYVYAVIATNSANSNYTLVNKQFIVGGQSSTPTTGLTYNNGVSISDTLKLGSFVSLSGTISSTGHLITSVEVGVWNEQGQRVTGATVSPNALSYDIRNLDSSVSFNSLPVGNYSFIVKATVANGENYALYTKLFSVYDGTVTPSANDPLTITGGSTVPSSINVGQAVNVYGTVTSSNSIITSLTAGVYDASNKLVTGRTVTPNSTSYNIQNLDYYVSFSTLPAGSYTYAVTATNSTNSNYTLVSQPFTVGNAASPAPAANDTLTITGGTNVPDNLAPGSIVNVTGTVTSASSNMTSLTVGVYDSNGRFVTGRTINPNAKSYNLRNLDAFVAFNKLTNGSYTYAVIASNAANTNYAIVTKKFTVGNGATEPSGGSLATISGKMTIPNPLAVGKPVNVTGVITATGSNLGTITAGVYQNNTLITGRTVNLNAKTYDLKNLDPYIAFDKLPAGEYRYLVNVTCVDGSGMNLVNDAFTVGNGGTTPVVNGSVSISNKMTIPNPLAVGKPVNVTGVITSSDQNIASVTVGVFPATTGSMVTGRTVTVNARSYDLKAVDPYIAFDKLQAGNYLFKVSVTLADGSSQTIVSDSFTVGNGGGQVNTNDTLTISGGTNVPDNLALGAVLSVTGVVTSANSNMSALTVGVYDSAGKFVTGRTINPNAKTYDLKNLDAYVAFNKLAAGSYTYAVIASNAGNTNYALVSKKFTVGNGQTTPTPSNTSDALTISGGMIVPDTMVPGRPLNVTGTVTSASSNITALTVGVYDANNKFVTGRTIAPNAKSYNLANLDAYVAFNKLAEGTYTYAVIASNAANTNYALVSKKFTVGNGGGGQSNTADSLTISGGTVVPDTISVGKAVAIRGTVTSASSNITSLTAGVYDANGKFITGRTVAPNAKTYNLANIDAYISFNTLPAGNYKYAVIATNASNSNYALVSKNFTVGNGGGGQSNTADKLTIAGASIVPDNLAQGKAFTVAGAVYSASSNITALTAGVYDANGKFVTGRTVAPNAKAYDLARLDPYISFNTLPAGKYVYAVIASNASNTNVALVNKSFTIGNGGGSTTGDALTISGSTSIPGTLNRGTGVAVRGTVTSGSSNISSVTVGVYNASGSMITGGTAKPGTKTYNLRALDNSVRFDTLTAGTYYYKVSASNGTSNGVTLVNQSFVVR